MAYGDFKDLTKRVAPDKVLRHKAFNIAKDPIFDGYQTGLASMVYKRFDKKLQVVVSLRLQINLLLNLYLEMKNWLKNFINLLLENSNKEECIWHSKKIFGVLI